MVNYYCDMWPQHSHFLAPLSSMTTAKVKWKWTPECQKAFDQMKAIMAKETLVAFPDFTKEFEIHIQMLVSYNLELASHKVASQ
jgi:hypothetical protein